MKAGIIFSAVLLAVSAQKAFAVDPWEFEVYRYATVGKGMLEVETLDALPLDGHPQAGQGTSSGTFASRHQWFTSLEVTYGLLDNLEAAAYLTLSKPADGELQYAGSRYRLRGSLFHEEELPINIGWYAELEQHRTPQFDEDRAEAELKPILEKEFGPIDLRSNLIFEKPISAAGWEFGAAWAAYYRVTKTISPGIELYDGTGPLAHADPLNEQQHYLFGVIMGSLGKGIEYNTGIGFGMTHNSDNVIIKANLELERFVGSLF